MSIYDDPAMQEAIKASGDFFKFSNVGDSISGTISTIRPVTFVKKTRDGDITTVNPQILMVTDAGEEAIVTCGATQLKAAIARDRPLPGDHITIAFTSEQQVGMGTMKNFDVKVTRGAGVADPWSPDEPSSIAPKASGPTIDEQAAAAAIAGLSAEQRKALGLPPF